MVAYTSVTLDEMPPLAPSDRVLGTVTVSGWVVEPISMNQVRKCMFGCLN
jgi:hypothetical protein